MHEKIEALLPMVDFLYYTVGKNCEIVLHDFSDLNHSVVAIRNNIITNRKIGDPAPPIIFDLAEKDCLPQNDININYLTHTKDGFPIKAVCYFVRDKSKTVGMLCVNIDDSSLLDLENIVRTLKSQHDLPIIDDKKKVSTSYLASFERTPAHTIEDQIKNEVYDIIKNNHVNPSDISTEKRIDLISQFYKKGIFYKKGAVALVAELLFISEPTVYRYLQNIKKKVTNTDDPVAKF